MQRFARAIAVSNIFGAGTLIVQVPGTFAGLNPGLPGFSGRQLINSSVWFGSPTAGDALTSVTAQDTDGLIPAGLRSQFPSYPILVSRGDPGMPLNNQGIYVPAQGIMLMPQPQFASVASGIYFIIGFQTGSGVVGTLIANTLWDDLT